MLEKLNAIFERLKRETGNFNDHLGENGFLENCMRIIESGWQAEFDDIESLHPFMVTTDPIENLFTRRYLLKLLSEAYASGRLKNCDIDWLRNAERNLEHALDQLTAETWPDTLCRFEPMAVVLGCMSYLLMFTNQRTHNPLVTISLATLPALYMGMSGSLNVMRPFSTMVRDLFFRTPEERRLAQTNSDLHDVMLTHLRRYVEPMFAINHENRQALGQIQPLSLLERVAAIHAQLASLTQNFASHIEEAGFVDHCFNLAENGWNERFEGIEPLAPFKSSDSSIMESLLKRLYLLKLMDDANINRERSTAIRGMLLTQLKSNLETSCRVLRYQGREILTPDDLNPIRVTGTRQLNRYQPLWPNAGAAVMLDLLWRHSNLSPEIKALLTSAIIVGSFAISRQLYTQSSAGLNALLFADRTQRRFDRQGVALLENPDFRNNFLAPQANIETVRPRDTADEAIWLIGKNSIQTLIGGIMLMSFGFMTDKARSASFWAGFILMAASILYYNQDNMNNARKHFGPGPK